MKKMVVKILGIALLLGTLFLPNAFASVNPKETSWTPLTPPTLACFHAEVVDGKIYSFGCEPRKSYSVKDKIIYDMEVYDPSTDTWIRLYSMPAMGPVLRTQVINGKIYGIGSGMRNNNPVDIEVYDPSTNTWSALPPMPTARLGFCSEVLDGKLYVIGGGNNDGVEGAVEVYDPSTGTWTKLASMPTYCTKRFGKFQSKIVGGKIYVMGVSDINKKAFLEVYDPTTDAWTKLTSMSTVRDYFETEVVDGKIYAIDGYVNGEEVLSIEAYDTSTDTWTMLPSMPTTRRYFKTEVVDGKICAIGGYNPDSELLKSIEVYDPSKDTWTTIASTENLIGETAVIDRTIYGIGRDSDRSRITMEALTVNTNDKNKQK